ncbi:type VI secretion system tube protein Hcp [Ferruginibacter sp. SUN106]|uniref:type VI secretion system tube protein Hcp n=1 Tax=Ferruginibacter sp. SUN106 TaxID=2978348 RepID=UPI003D36FE55
MRTIILLLMLSPLLSTAQNTNIYIKLTDATGQIIKGESVVKGFERQIQATSTSAAGKNNTQFNFTMAVSGASADLKKAMATGQLLPSGDVVAMAPNGLGAPAISYTIKLEQVKVIACTEAMGCNGITNTTISLQANRIGWTYYSISKTGSSTVSRKFGWDAIINAEWTNF